MVTNATAQLKPIYFLAAFFSLKNGCQETELFLINKYKMNAIATLTLLLTSEV